MTAEERIQRFLPCAHHEPVVLPDGSVLATCRCRPSAADKAQIIVSFVIDAPADLVRDPDCTTREMLLSLQDEYGRFLIGFLLDMSDEVAMTVAQLDGEVMRVSRCGCCQNPRHVLTTFDEETACPPGPCPDRSPPDRRRRPHMNPNPAVKVPSTGSISSIRAQP